VISLLCILGKLFCKPTSTFFDKYKNTLGLMSGKPSGTLGEHVGELSGKLSGTLGEDTLGELHRKSPTRLGEHTLGEVHG
jgi:hypothetical protein